jgi:hypothetical protein
VGARRSGTCYSRNPHGRPVRSLVIAAGHEHDVRARPERHRARHDARLRTGPRRRVSGDHRAYLVIHRDDALRSPLPSRWSTPRAAPVGAISLAAVRRWLT